MGTPSLFFDSGESGDISWHPFYNAGSLLSGLIWGLIGSFLCFDLFGLSVVAGILLSPIIGWVIGRIYLFAYRCSWFVQFFVSLITLYIATALFGASLGIGKMFVTDGTAFVIGESINAVLMGLTLGWVFLFWPLAFVNHWILGLWVNIENGNCSVDISRYFR